MDNHFILRGRGLSGGVVEGEALLSEDNIVWAHGVHPPTGIISDQHARMYGKCVRSKILIYPYGRGSTTGSTWMLETIRCGNGPKAIINIETELIIVTGTVLANALYGLEIPVIDRLDKDPFEYLQNGDWLKVDGNKGTVEILKKSNA